MDGIRFDRLASLYAFGPLVRVMQPTGQRRLPILMYHSISTAPERTAAYYRTCTHPAVFARQMGLLAERGWKALDLDTAMDVFQRSPEETKLVAITFDDGYRTVLTHALPALQRWGFSATVYLPTGMINERRESFKGDECLTWSEVSELRRAGIRFGSHTVTHPVLYDLAFSSIREELRASKATIEDHLGEDISSFAYPYAFPSADRGFVKAFVDLLVDGGYKNAVTTRIGRARQSDDVYTLKRLPVNSCDDDALLLGKLQGAYDWLAGCQAATKTYKRWTGKRRAAERQAPAAHVASSRP